MVAAHVGISPGGQHLLLRNTTWLPTIPGLGALATMIFAPQVIYFNIFQWYLRIIKKGHMSGSNIIF